MMISYILIAGHLICGAVAYILERDRLRNTLMFKTESKDYKKNNFSNEDHRGSRRCFSSLFKVSKIKNGFCVSRHRYSNNTVITNTLLSLFGGLFYLLTVLGRVFNTLSIQDTVITDNYDDAVVLFGERIMGGIDGYGELEYDILYFPKQDFEVYTKSSLLYKVKKFWDSTKGLKNYLNEKISVIKEVMNEQR